MLSATRFNQREVRFHNASQHARWDNGRKFTRLIGTAVLVCVCVAPWLYLLAVVE